MYKHIIICNVVAVLFSGPVMSSTITITNLHTQQQLSRSTALNNEIRQKQRQSCNCSGYPVYDATAIMLAKHQLYEQWLKENKSKMDYEDWEKMMSEGGGER
ncbi:TPA: hypothetical protein P6484_004260 [Escherichia coli]|nr:hypothetical protein [Escherichia coli]